ncbi:MAG: amidohydrolase family protein [Rhodospirillales bacterium]|nr:amidohydrolase family protein [Rhodospirillales bacterium]
MAESFLARYPIEKMVLSHTPAGGKNVMYKFFALKRFLQGKDRFAFLGGGGSLNPMIHRHDADSGDHKNLVEEFDKIADTIILAGGAGYGEMSSLHISVMPGHEYNFQPADHPLFRRLADIAARHDVPIELHNDAVVGIFPAPRGLRHNDNPGNFPGTIKSLERLLAYNPKAKISWAHGGSDPLGEMTPRLILRMMDKYANLYMSLRINSGTGRASNLVFDGRGLDTDWSALLKRHPDRFFIGTDAMFVAPQIPKKGPAHKFAENNDTRYEDTARFLSLLPDDLALKIASGNAKRIYRLSPRAPAFAVPGPQGGAGQKKKFLAGVQIIATVTGNTLRFNAPSHGKSMRVYFGEGGNSFGGIFTSEKGKIEVNRNRFASNPSEIATDLLEGKTLVTGIGPHHDDFLDSIKTREDPSANIDVAIRATDCCHIGNIARWLGRKVVYDPATRTFPGDAEANALCSREQRAPYEIPDVGPVS